MIINLRYDAAASAAGAASFRAGIQQAANILASTIPDNITVNLNIVYSGTGGGAAAGPDNGLYENYSSIRGNLINNASPGDTTFNALPSGTSIQNQSLVAVWNAQLKLLGLLMANDTTTDDGTATFATDIDPNLLVGVALHELTHALGRVPYGPQPDVFDLFRFSSPGTWLFLNGNTAPAGYFSVDGGNTKLADYGQHSDPSDFLNPGPTFLGLPYSNLTPNDPFNELYDPGTAQQLTAVDLKQLDALGFHLSSPVLTPSGWANRAGEKVVSGHLVSSGSAADIAAIGPGQGGIAAYVANGDGTFHTVFSSQVSSHSDWDSWPNAQTITGDFLHNGLTDLAVINPGQGGIADYLSNGDGTFHAVFSAQAGTDWDSWPNPKLISGDFLGNGRADIAVINNGQGGIADYVSNGDGTFHAVFSSQVATHTDWASWSNPKMVTGDFLHNGLTDLAVFNPGQGGIADYLSNGDGTFRAVFSAQVATHSDWGSWPNPTIVTGDFLGNGHTDIAVLNPGQGGIADYLSNGDGTFHAVFSPQGATHTDWDSWSNAKAVTGDFLGNGHTDIAVFNPGQGGIALYLPNGDGTFHAVFSSQAVTHTDWDSWANPTVVTGDFNGDGRVDLAVTNQGQGGVAVYLSNGDGTFTGQFTATTASGTAVADVSGLAMQPSPNASTAAPVSVASVGGAGGDSFVFNSINESTPDNPETIANFISGSDHFDLSAIAGITAVQLNEPLSGGTLNAHSVAWIVNGNDVDVFANSSASAEVIGGAGGNADMQVHVTNVSTLLASDFLLHA